MAEFETQGTPPWYADGLQFTCTQCGNCCSGAPGHVWVSDEEIHSIAQWVGKDALEFTRVDTRRVGSRRSLLEHRNGDCVFLERTAEGKTRCSIWAARPLQCRTWPFWKSNIDTPAAWKAAARGCPGMNQGEHHPLPVIQAALQRNGQANLRL